MIVHEGSNELFGIKDFSDVFFSDVDDCDFLIMIGEKKILDFIDASFWDGDTDDAALFTIIDGIDILFIDCGRNLLDTSGNFCEVDDEDIVDNSPGTQKYEDFRDKDNEFCI